MNPLRALPVPLVGVAVAIGCAANTQRPGCPPGKPTTPAINVRPHVSAPGLTLLILDRETNAPIPGAMVSLPPSTAVAAHADQEGMIRLRTLAGNIKILVRSVGYGRAEDTVSIPHEGGRFLIVQLRDMCYQIEPVISSYSSFLHDASSRPGP